MTGVPVTDTERTGNEKELRTTNRISSVNYLSVTYLCAFEMCKGVIRSKPPRPVV